MFKSHSKYTMVYCVSYFVADESREAIKLEAESQVEGKLGRKRTNWYGQDREVKTRYNGTRHRNIYRLKCLKVSTKRY